MRPNPGHVPDDCEITDPETGEVVAFRKVHVRLFNGWTSHGIASWPAARGRPPTVWTISAPPHPFEISEYEVSHD